jgi:GNAT superfamily N-acetyltransferase
MDTQPLSFGATSTAEVAAMRATYVASLAGPLDGMWEVFIDAAVHWEIRVAGETAGYFCVDEEGQLLQFHVTSAFEKDAPKIFAGVVARDDVKGAIVRTAEPAALGVCLDVHKKVRVHSYLYQDQDESEVTLTGRGDLTFQPVTAAELDEVEIFQRSCFDDDLGEWLVGYLKNLVSRSELHALRSGAELLGTGETRVSETQIPHVDLGVIVSREHRGAGIAPYILWRLKELCYRRGEKPICSTTVDNVASQRAIQKAGFVSRFRLLEIGF